VRVGGVAFATTKEELEKEEGGKASAEENRG